MLDLGIGTGQKQAAIERVQVNGTTGYKVSGDQTSFISNGTIENHVNVARPLHQSSPLGCMEIEQYIWYVTARRRSAVVNLLPGIPQFRSPTISPSPKPRHLSRFILPRREAPSRCRSMGQCNTRISHCSRLTQPYPNLTPRSQLLVPLCYRRRPKRGRHLRVAKNPLCR
jgi:hypothetical protein